MWAVTKTECFNTLRNSPWYLSDPVVLALDDELYDVIPPLVW